MGFEDFANRLTPEERAAMYAAAKARASELRRQAISDAGTALARAIASAWQRRQRGLRAATRVS